MDSVKLTVLADYRCREVAYSPGAVIEVTAERAAFLMADAPGCFEVYQPKRVRKNTAVKAPVTK